VFCCLSIGSTMTLWQHQEVSSVRALYSIHPPRQAAAMLLLLRMPPAADEAKTMRRADKKGSLKVLTVVLSASDPQYTAYCRTI